MIPFPSILVNRNNIIIAANHASELYLLTSIKRLKGREIADVFRGVSSLSKLLEDVRHKNETLVHYGLSFSSPSVEHNYRNVHIIPYHEENGDILILFEAKGNLDHLKNSLTYRTAADSVTRMSAMLAHEIRNPLAGIYGAAQLLDKSVNSSDKELTDLIKLESKRIGKLVDTFEKFGELGPLNLKHFNVHDILDKAIASMATVFDKNINIVKNYDPSLPEVFGDPDKVLQVFQNLIKNSFEAIGERLGTITIFTKFKLGFKNLPLVITISDNGPGIPKNIQNQIFQPFISEKSQGTGLGLSLVSKLISDHNGIVDFLSDENGTTFRLLLPMKKIAKDEQSDLEYLQMNS